MTAEWRKADGITDNPERLANGPRTGRDPGPPGLGTRHRQAMTAGTCALGKCSGAGTRTPISWVTASGPAFRRHRNDQATGRFVRFSRSLAPGCCPGPLAWRQRWTIVRPHSNDGASLLLPPRVGGGFWGRGGDAGGSWGQGEHGGRGRPGSQAAAGCRRGQAPGPVMRQSQLRGTFPRRRGTFPCTFPRRRGTFPRRRGTFPRRRGARSTSALVLAPAAARQGQARR